MRIIGIFDEEDALVHAVKSLKARNIEIDEVYSPYPVHEVLHLVGRKSRIPTAAYFYGLFGAIGILAFLYWTSVISWPVVYGGKPFNSFPSFIVITLVLTILTVTITSLFTFSWRAKLYPGREDVIIDPRTTDNKFLLVVSEFAEGTSRKEEVEGLLRENGASEIYEKELKLKKA